MRFDMGDVPNWGLLVGAVVTAIFAILAFAKQSKDVRDQAELIRIQGEQLKEMKKTTAKQVTTLELQAKELRASLAQREREELRLERQQADGIDLTWYAGENVTIVDATMTARSDNRRGLTLVIVKNNSRRPIRNVACRVNPRDGRTLAPVSTGLFWPAHGDFGGRPVAQMLDATTSPVIGPGRAGGFLIELSPQTDSTMAARFTDDTLLDWQIDQELHLEKLEERDW